MLTGCAITTVATTFAAPTLAAYGPEPAVGGGLIWLALAVVGGVFAALCRAGRSASTRTPTLVLTAFATDPAPAGVGPCLDIVGRPTGVLAWLLTTMGLSTQTRWTVTDLQVSIHSAGLSGELNNAVPLAHVSGTHCGYTKPFALLVVAAAQLIGAIAGGLAAPSGGAGVVLLGLVVAGVLLAVYWTRKQITL